MSASWRCRDCGARGSMDVTTANQVTVDTLVIIRDQIVDHHLPSSDLCSRNQLFVLGIDVREQPRESD